MAEGLLHIEAAETVIGLEGTWVRVRDHGWTMAITKYLASHLTYAIPQCVEWVHRWVVECHLPVLPADVMVPPVGDDKTPYTRRALEPITDPKALTVDILENEMDSKMVGFLISAIHQGAQTAYTLSPFAVRILSNGTGKQPEGPNDTPAKGPSRRRKKSRSAP